MSEVFERALRYRESYDSSRGDPAAWLIGIAQRCIAGASRPLVLDPEGAEKPALGRMDEEVQQRLTLKAALATLSGRDQELLALRYGGDLTARQIADLLELKVNTVEVASTAPWPGSGRTWNPRESGPLQSFWPACKGPGPSPGNRGAKAN